MNALIRKEPDALPSSASDIDADTNSCDAILKLYEGSLRALDTKAQIFLAFLAITMTPVFNRFDALELDYWIKGTAGASVSLATFAFIFCLLPRRGRRASGGLFRLEVRGADLADDLRTKAKTFDRYQTVAVLHDIYRLKARSVTLGTWLVAAFILIAATGFTLG